MKKLIPLFALALFFTACKKDTAKDDGQETKTYINTTSGSTWSYHETDNSGTTPHESDYTVTSTDKDTTIEGKSFHIYAYSAGGFQYLGKVNKDYYQYDSIPGLGKAIVRNYLKSGAKAGDTWNQDITVPIEIAGIPINVPVKLANKVVETGSRTVNGITYENVIHVQTTISSPQIPDENLDADIHAYYAENYGLIESSASINLDYSGIKENVDVKIILTSSDLK